ERPKTKGRTGSSMSQPAQTSDNRPTVHEPHRLKARPAELRDPLTGKAHKWADMAIRESEARFRLMTDAAPVMVWMSGPDKLCTYFNKHWLDFTGRPLQRQLGNGWSEGVHPDDLQRCLDTYGRALDARQEFRMEYRLQRFDGE